MLWIQERVEDGELEMVKVKWEENPADLMTKHLGKKVIHTHMGALSQEVAAGRAKASLKV